MTEITIERQEAADCFETLWGGAVRKDPFGAICTLLRVCGLEDSGWDPFEESREAFDDFNWHLKAEADELSAKSKWRVGLLMYCHAVEISAVHDTLANLLRLLLGQPYRLHPLGLGTKKKGGFRWAPPSAKTKWTKIRTMAEEAGRADLVRLIDAVYDNRVRNAFSHSDYVMTADQFRWTEGGLGEQIPLAQVSNLISNSFSFFGAFIALRDRWLQLVGDFPKYRKMPEYEVFESLKGGDGKLCGFRMHFSNGNGAHFKRTDDGVDLVNLTFEGDGEVGFMVGDLAARKSVWMVDGKQVDFGSRNYADKF